MTIFNELTIIIPTYNRPHELKRLLLYLDKSNLNISICILDSSEIHKKKINKQTICALRSSNLKIEYFEYPPDIPAFDKYKKGILHANTKYVMFCADDDVPFLPTLECSVSFLQTHPDYVAVHGYYLNFSLEDQQDSKIQIQHLLYASDSIEDESYLVRITQLFEKYEALFYAVCRLDVLQKAFTFIQSVQTTLWQELILAAAIVIQGKVKRLPSFYYARSTGESSEFINWHPHEIFSRDPSLFFQDYLAYRAALFNGFSEKFETAHAKRVFDLAHMVYIHAFLKLDILTTIRNRSDASLSSDSLAQLIREDQRLWLSERRQRVATSPLKDVHSTKVVNRLKVKTVGKLLVARFPFLEFFARKIYCHFMPDLLRLSPNGSQFTFWREFLGASLLTNSQPTIDDQKFIVEQLEKYY